MRNFIAFWNIFMKDVRNYYLKPPNISWGIIFPLAWTLMQLIRSAGNVEIIELLPGLMAMSVLFGTTSMVAVTITFERRGHSFDRLLLAPIRLGTLVLAKLSGAVIFGVISAFVPVAYAALFIDLNGIDWTVVTVDVVLMAITSALIGLLIAVSAKEVFEAQTFSNFFRFPMLFLCGLFVPIEQLPDVLKTISFCLPLTYGTDILNGIIKGKSFFEVKFSLFMMAAFGTAFFYLCQRRIRKKWIL